MEDKEEAIEEEIVEEEIEVPIVIEAPESQLTPEYIESRWQAHLAKIKRGGK